MKKIFMFSGQGSQYFNMAKVFFKKYAAFRDSMEYLNDLVYELKGISVLDYIYDENKNLSEPCDRIRYTHPAIFMVEYSMYEFVKELGITPDYLLGSSLGEYSALAVSGAMELNDILELIILQSEYLEKYCVKGKMAALLHPFHSFSQDESLSSGSELAAVNSSDHFVIAGSEDRMNQIIQYAKNQKIVLQELPIQYAFHSELLEVMHDKFAACCKKYPISSPKIPIISCTYGDKLSCISEGYLWDILRKPILLQETILKLEVEGNYTYIDLGPASSLTNLVKRNFSAHSNSESYPLLTMFGQDERNLEILKENFCHS